MLRKETRMAFMLFRQKMLEALLVSENAIRAEDGNIAKQKSARPAI